MPEKSDAGIKFMHIGVVELLEGAVVQCLADALHQVIVEVQVVHDSQAHAQQLVCFLQMADIRAGNIIEGVYRGVDLFDCVMPIR